VSFRYDADLMLARTGAAHRALDQSPARSIGPPRCSVLLKAGDMLVVDNRGAIHGRSTFTPRHDGLDRRL